MHLFHRWETKGYEPHCVHWDPYAYPQAKTIRWYDFYGYCDVNVFRPEKYYDCYAALYQQCRKCDKRRIARIKKLTPRNKPQKKWIDNGVLPK